MEWATKGASALAGHDQAPAAVNYFTKALIEHPSSPDYFTQRAVAFSRLKPARHDLALRDAEYAVLLAQKRAKREKIQAAQQRRVVALYGLERYLEARWLLNQMLKWRGKDNKKDKMEHDMWMAKINGKIKDGEDNVYTFKEYPEVNLPDESSIRKWLQGQLKKDGTFRFDGEPDTEDSTATSTEAKSAHIPMDHIVVPEAEPLKPATSIRHDFYQNGDSLIVTFYAKKVDASKFTFELDTDSLSISFPNPDNLADIFTFSARPTFGSLDTSKSTYKVFGTKIELVLAKSEKGLKWPTLQATDRPVSATLPNPYVTKSRNDQDWDKRVAEITKKTPKKKEDNKPGSDHSDHDDASDVDSEDGGDAVDGFFKKLYKGADDDTRKAMMKSFQESNGTSLSTNWADVSKGKVEEVRSKAEK